MYGLTLQTAATSEPVTLDEVKRQVSVGLDVAFYDSVLTSYLKAARGAVERYTGRQLVTATYDYQFDQFPCGLDSLYLPKSPLASVTSVTYLAAADGASTVWTSSDYRVITSTEPGYIVPAYEDVYPSTRSIAGAITVRFVAGAAVASVPEELKSVIKMLVTNLFEGRGGETLMSDAVKFLLESWRVPDDFLTYGREPQLTY